MKVPCKYVAATLISVAGVLAPVAAQEAIKRTPLDTMDFPPGYQTVKGYAEIAKGTCSPGLRMMTGPCPN